MYMMNAAIGSIFMILLAAAAIIKWNDITPYLQKIPGEYYGVGGAMILAGLTSMNFVSAPSISVEGKISGLPRRFRYRRSSCCWRK